MKYGMKYDYGLKIGTVKRNAGGGKETMDPNCVTVSIQDGENRIKDVTARVLASFAGNEFGSVIIPQDGEQVLIGYLNGNPNGEAYILGSVFQGKIKPPYDITKTVAAGDTNPGDSMVIKLKNETQISINNANDKNAGTLITITTGTKNRIIQLIDKSDNSFLQIADSAIPKTYIKIDFQNGAIECKADKKMSFVAGANKGSVTLDGESGNISIESQGSIAINSKGGSTLSCNSSKVTAAASGVTVEGAQTTIKGNTQAKIESPSVSIGQMVKLG